MYRLSACVYDPAVSCGLESIENGDWIDRSRNLVPTCLGSLEYRQDLLEKGGGRLLSPSRVRWVAGSQALVRSSHAPWRIHFAAWGDFFSFGQLVWR